MLIALRTVAARIAYRFALMVCLVACWCALPSAVDGWHEGGPVEAVYRCAAVLSEIVRDLVLTIAG